MKPEEEFERLTLADGSEVHAQGYVQFVLHCGNYKTRIFPQVFPNLHEELILGIPWLVKENPIINWSIGLVIVERDGIVYTLPCYRECLNKPEDRESERSKVMQNTSALSAPRQSNEGCNENQAMTESIRD